MQILFQHSFEYPIWRLIPSLSDHKTYLIELREERSKQVFFYFLDNSYHLKKIDTQLNWWTGVEALVGNSVVFHGFLQEDLPIHKGIKVWDTKKNEWQWKNEFLTFVNVEDTILLAKNSLGSLDTVLKIDLLTGQETSFELKYNNSNSFVSQIVGKDEPYFEDIVRFVSQYTHFAPIEFCEYLETNDHILISYYTQNGKKFDNYLLVTNTVGQELLHLCLAEGSKGLAAGTFHVSDALLSFVKDKNELFIVTLQ